MSKNQKVVSIEKAFSPKRILVAIDGSDNSKRAVEVATTLAKVTGGELFLVMVVPEEIESTGPPEGLAYSSWEERGNAIIFEDSKIPQSNQVEVTGHVIRPNDSVASEIVGYARDENMDLIVIGTRGRSALKKLLLGSVSDAVVRQAHCNVLVVR
jgi:nucleotide-binding universal stress UspA family protein